MEILHVQFNDSSMSEIVSVLGSPQDPELYQNQKTISSSDQAYADFYAKLTDASKQSLPTPEYQD